MNAYITCADAAAIARLHCISAQCTAAALRAYGMVYGVLAGSGRSVLSLATRSGAVVECTVHHH